MAVIAGGHLTAVEAPLTGTPVVVPHSEATSREREPRRVGTGRWCGRRITAGRHRGAVRGVLDADAIDGGARCGASPGRDEWNGARNAAKLVDVAMR